MMNTVGKQLGRIVGAHPKAVRPLLALRTVLLASIALSSALTASAEAMPDAYDQGPILTLTEENDFVNGTDRWNTQGARISFLQRDNHVPRWTEKLLNSLPALGFVPGANRIGYEAGQSMFTPADTHEPGLQERDRPYAGWLYGGLIVQRRGAGIGGYRTLENLQLELGIIGPDSLADQSQTWYHKRAPQVWDHQLKNEPGIAVKYGRAWLIPFPSSNRRYVDLIPQTGLSAGNVDTSFRVGATIRAGWNLPNDFGTQPIDSVIVPHGGWSSAKTGSRWGFYFFTGAGGRAVLYTAFLDGNAFRDSHHVDKEPYVGEWRSGLALVFDRVELTYSHIVRSPEFHGQPESQIYGSLSLHVKF